MAAPKLDIPIKINEIEGLIEADPNRPGPDRVVLVGTGIPVWAVIAHLQALTGDDITEKVPSSAIKQAAIDYEIDERLIVAAVEHYVSNRAQIDVKLARNAAAVY